jgi:hypothetical protein
MSSNIFYVYKYIDEMGVPYYIGKGKGFRMDGLHNNVLLPPKEQRVKVQENLTEEEALALENHLIRLYGRKLDGGTLENIKINQWVGSSGWKHSERTKQLISEKNTGKTRTLEQRLNYKKPKSPEHIEKIRQANIGRKPDGRNEKISVTMSKKRWYTNGVMTKMFEPGTEMIGFTPGRKIGS